MRRALLSRPLPPMFERRVVTVLPGAARQFDPAEWRDAIVAVERGAIELECRDGDLCGFRRDDLLSLSGLSLRVLRNPGTEPAVLVAVRRRPGGEELRAVGRHGDAQARKGPRHEH